MYFSVKYKYQFRIKRTTVDIFFDLDNLFIWQVGEQLDLLDLYVQKIFDKKLDDAMKVLTDLGNKTRSTIQNKLKSSD